MPYVAAPYVAMLCSNAVVRFVVSRLVISKQAGRSLVACSVAMPYVAMLCSNALWNDIIALQRWSVACSVAVLRINALRLCRVTLHTSALPLLPCSLCGCSGVCVVDCGNTLQLLDHCDDVIHAIAGDGFHRFDV